MHYVLGVDNNTVHSCHVVHSFQLILMLFACMCVCVCMCVCINCVYFFIVFFFECVGVLPFDGEIKMYIYIYSGLGAGHMIDRYQVV